MKIQAFTIIAVVAALLPVVNCAPAKNESKEEDRSCTKRDEDARKEKGPVVACNYFCHPYENSYYYEEKHYPDGVVCMYTDTVESKCKNNECPPPEEDMEKKNKTETGQNDEGGKQDKDEGKDNEKGGTGEVSTEGSEQGKEKPKENEVSTEGSEQGKENTTESEVSTEGSKQGKENTTQNDQDTGKEEKKEEEKKEEEKKEEKGEEGKDEEKKEGELSKDADDTAKTK
ncbi:cilia- and flagella-associated protein 251-like [Ixodes scapularis]|uniref:cilia- and flagella-associated protein 251-like n=1 Tax=Ixodes scapularis TaxID=6945 RepID=UPI001C37F08A|nr:cilia- and flagella-associated protein 251-like [Ixodes scapularis]